MLTYLKIRIKPFEHYLMFGSMIVINSECYFDLRNEKAENFSPHDDFTLK